VYSVLEKKRIIIMDTKRIIVGLTSATIIVAVAVIAIGIAALVYSLQKGNNTASNLTVNGFTASGTSTVTGDQIVTGTLYAQPVTVASITSVSDPTINGVISDGGLTTGNLYSTGTASVLGGVTLPNTGGDTLGSTLFNFYAEYVAAAVATGAIASTNINIGVKRFGNLVQLSWPAITGAFTSSNPIIITFTNAFPTWAIPPSTQTDSVLVTNNTSSNAANGVGSLVVNPATITASNVINFYFDDNATNFTGPAPSVFAAAITYSFV
jgi:hypothetical protein